MADTGATIDARAIADASEGSCQSGRAFGHIAPTQLVREERTVALDNDLLAIFFY